MGFMISRYHMYIFKYTFITFIYIHVYVLQHLSNRWCLIDVPNHFIIAYLSYSSAHWAPWSPYIVHVPLQDENPWRQLVYIYIYTSVHLTKIHDVYIFINLNCVFIHTVNTCSNMIRNWWYTFVRYYHRDIPFCIYSICVSINV